MARLRHPVVAVLALVAACGGKVLVDNGGGDPGGGQGGTTSVTTGTAGSLVVTTGAGGTGTGTVPGTGTGPGTGTEPGTGTFGTGGVSIGASGSTGVAGAVGTGGSSVTCGTPDSCAARIPGPLPCSNQAACLCKSCSCPANACLGDAGCQRIWACSLRFNCRGLDCYTPQTCKAIIDQSGGASASMTLALHLDQCLTQSGCDTVCGGAVDAGPACGVPPPAVGVSSCTSGSGQDECYQECADSQMNTRTAKCSGNSCTCFYNGQLSCRCSLGAAGGPGACAICCPGFPG